MKKILFIFGVLVLLTGCSNEEVKTGDILANIADINFRQSFEIADKKSVSMYVEVYEHGKRNDEKILSFGTEANGHGVVQFSGFHLQNAGNEMLLIGAVQNKNGVSSFKINVDVPNLGWISSGASNEILKVDDETVMGAFAFFEGDFSPVSFGPLIERGEFVAAYEKFSVVYVVVADIR